MFRNHDVIKYLPKNTWCHHGLAVVFLSKDGQMSAKDTYWGIGDTSYDSGWLDDSEIQAGVVVGNIDEFECDKYREYDDYNDEDKFFVPVGGGSPQQWYRVGAEPNPDLIYRRLVYELEKADNEIQYAQHRRDCRSKLLREHINSYGIPKEQQ